MNIKKYYANSKYDILRYQIYNHKIHHRIFGCAQDE